MRVYAIARRYIDACICYSRYIDGYIDGSYSICYRTESCSIYTTCCHYLFLQAAGKFLILSDFGRLILRSEQVAGNYCVARRQVADSWMVYRFVCMCAHVCICLCVLHVYVLCVACVCMCID